MIAESALLELQRTLYSSRNPTRRWLHCTRRDWIIDQLRRHAGNGRRDAVEVGFGSGVYLPLLAELYGEVVAVDQEKVFIEHAQVLAQKYPNLRVLDDDITRSKLPDIAFDLVLFSEVIEHIADSEKALAEIYRILRPRGILIMSTPQPLSPLELTAKIAFAPGILRLVKLVYREAVVKTGHINLMSEKRATSQLEAAGFSIRERFKSGVYLPLMAEFMGRAALRLEQWLEPRMRGGLFDRLLWVQYYIAEKPAVPR
jgi:SAM-dependent methyltransferase